MQSVKEIFDLRKRRTSEMHFLHGIRCICAFIVIFLHYCLVTKPSTRDEKNISRNDAFITITTTLIDVLFAISGVLACRKILGQLFKYKN